MAPHALRRAVISFQDPPAVDAFNILGLGQETVMVPDLRALLIGLAISQLLDLIPEGIVGIHGTDGRRRGQVEIFQFGNIFYVWS